MTHLPGVEQMEEVLNRLQALSPDELRAEIIKAGLNCGPITGTTRALFEKKLGNAILENQSGGGKALKPSSSTGASPSSVVHDGEDFGYSLGLNPPEEQLLMSSCISSEDGSGPQEASQEAPSQFYGVCLPLDDGFVEMDKAHVYENRTEAMKAVKKMKGARFKIFSSREDAERFAKGSGESCSSPGKMTMDGSVGNTDEPVVPELDRVNGERANGYKTPRTQDMTAKLRKAVEKGDLTAFSKLVWSNPRYLIGSGDNPTIVQEGCRYNVMHVAARENQPGIAQLLLDTLENMEFMRLMYPDDQEDMLRNRIHYIVDLYLNTPDKAAFETPLHFACKFGCPEVVNVLCSHPDTDKNCKNKYNQKPFSVICERKNKTQEVKQKIREYLEDKFYVPLLRATDNSSQPVIGAPWSPECLDPVPHWLSPELPGSPKDPIMIVRAIAGPFSQTKAVAFRRMWKTPPRDRATYFQHMLKSDPNRGAEQVGRELAHELGYLWVESWEFLGTFIDLATPDGLEMLEEYLSTKDHSKKGPEEIKNKRTSDHVEKCPPGNIQNICNSITVGAFLDEDAEVAPDEEVLENMRGATLRRFLMTCDPNSPEQDESQGWLCSPGNDRSGPNPGRHSCDSSCTFPLPISNLMAEFEKASVMDLNRQPDRSCERGQEGSEFDDASSISSEEYFTAEESEDEAPTTGHISSQSRFRNRKLSEDGSESSASSYKSLHSSHEDLMPKTPPPNRQDFFIEGASPTKLDSEVLSALKAIEVDPQKYPCVNRWRNMIQGFTSSQMQSWPSPMGVKNRPRTPGSPCSPVLSPGSPSPARCRLIHRLYQSYLSHFPI